jgi:hypothetical protein
MNASFLGNVMLLERKKHPANISKKHHFGRWWPFARQCVRGIDFAYFYDFSVPTDLCLFFHFTTHLNNK